MSQYYEDKTQKKGSKKSPHAIQKKTIKLEGETYLLIMVLILIGLSRNL